MSAEHNPSEEPPHAQPKTEPSPEEILSAVRTAGWLLERETARVLSNASFYTSTGRAFPDPDAPTTSRELDVVGYREIFRDETLRMSIGVEVLAECKQSELPYVILGSEGYAAPRDGKYSEQLFRYPYVATKEDHEPGSVTRVTSTPARKFLGLTDLPANPWELRFIGTQMTRMNRQGKQWKANNEGIFTSLVMPLAKALTHFRKERAKYQSGRHDRNHDWAEIVFFYPLVVTSATVYTVDVTASQPAVSRARWASLTRELQSSSIDGQFTIDVVHAGDLETYLVERIGVFAEAVAAVASADPEAFITHEAP